MLKELLDSIVLLAHKSVEPKRIDIKDPRAACFYAGDGKHVAINLPEPPRDHAVKQLDDLIALANRFGPGDSPSDEDSGVRPVVWYDESAVVLIIDDDGHRCEKATLSLVESDAFKVVRSLAGGTKAPTYDQKSFIRLLRIDLAGTLPPSVLLDVVRRIKIENGQVTTSEVRKNRESMGREITAAVSAEADVPDTVILSVPVYKTFAETDRYPVNATVEVDAISGRFSLIPFPDEIEHVQSLAVSSIAERLKDGLPEVTPFYYGSPTRS